MSEADDKDVLAAEYVLGTLDAEDRANAHMLMAIDPAFAEDVARWQSRLGELHALVDPVEPPPSNWEWIKARIANVQPGGKLWLPGVAEAASSLPPAEGRSGAAASAANQEPMRRAEAVEPSRPVRRWQALAAAAVALALLVAGLAVLREARPLLLPEALRPEPRVVEKPVEVIREVVREVASQRIAEFVAVFQRDDALPAPAFLLAVDVARRVVSVRRVGAEQPPDKSYELWIVTPREPRPRSLGLIEPDGFTVRRGLADYDAPTLHNATFGISLEPAGGSPTGQPTGPIIHGKLIQTTPAAFPSGTP
ncbi:MAG TPA: anti-sigma factor [Xanthobacteraceae bacterium]|nr:anti-sigma factor [Xanthobacteraceae bacterium]